jgi:hypothetical protein
MKIQILLLREFQFLRKVERKTLDCDSKRSPSGGLNRDFRRGRERELGLLNLKWKGRDQLEFQMLLYFTSGANFKSNAM